jgi:hypothetical protein
MATYRISRSVEASLIDWITEELSDAGWTGIRVEKSFAQVYKGTLPCILIEQDPEDDIKLEIGSKTWLKNFSINIRIFATSDGQRLDLKDFITDLLENDINYYSYVITNGEVAQKDLTGRIVILKITRNEKELKNTENLESVDRYRNIISFQCYIAD